MTDQNTVSKDNIALTKKVVEYAHSKGVVVEGELGKLAGIEDDVNVKAEDASYTNPDEVEEFVSRTGVDSLAIAIGTSMGPLSLSRDKNHSFGLIFWQRLKNGFRITPSCCTALHP